MKYMSGICIGCLLQVIPIRAGAQTVDWTLTNWPMSAPYVSGIVVDTSNRIIACTYGDGLYRSTSDGATWTRLSAPDSDVSCLAVDASQHIFIGTWGHGIYRSTDHGESWARHGLDSMRIDHLAFGSPGSIFAGVDIRYGSADVSLYRSTNDGSTWQAKTAGIPGFEDVQSIAAGPAGAVYASPFMGGVFRSTDTGDTWAPTALGAPIQIYSLLVTQPGHVFAGGVRRLSHHR